MKGSRKSLLSIALAVVLLVSVCFISVAETPVSLSGWTSSSGAYSVTQNTVTVNNNGRNNFVVSDTSVKNFVLEADITSPTAGNSSNSPCFGIAFGIQNRTNLVDTVQSSWNNDFIQATLQRTGASVHSFRLFRDAYQTYPGFNVTAAINEYKTTNRMRVEVVGSNITVTVNGIKVADYDYAAYNGGYVGFGTYNAEATFSNIRFINLDQVGINGDTAYVTNSSQAGYTVNEDDSVTLNFKENANNFVSTETLTLPQNFTFEADIVTDKLSDLTVHGFMLFVNNSTAQSSTWSSDHLGVVIEKNGQLRIFNLGTNDYFPIENSNMAVGAVNNLRVQVKGENLKVWVNGDLTAEMDIKGLATRTYRNFGYLGYDSQSTYKNIKYIPETYSALSNYYGAQGKYSVSSSEDSIVLNKNSGNNYLVSDKYLTSFEMEADVTLSNGGQVGGFLFGAQTADATKISNNWYAVHIGGGAVRLFYEKDRSAATGLDIKVTGLSLSGANRLRVVVEGSRMRVYVNGILYIDTEYAVYGGGYVGVCDYANTTTFKNLRVNEITLVDDTVPELSSLSLSGATLNREFDPEVYNYVAQVPNSSSSIELFATIGEENSAMVNNTAFKDGKATHSLKVGYNTLNIVVFNKSGSSTLTYTVIVKRDADLETVYSSSDRAQLHFSAQQNWINDPNGLVYNAYRDEYHLFYQHNPYGNAWGNMSWGHAVSKDLVNWEEIPVALFVDGKGQKWSGCAVIDKNNTSGLFDDSTHPDDRMVFFISNWSSTDGSNLQLAYSTDGGRTLEYYNNGEFILKVQDPKVIWHEESQKWLLIPTNGNIYYSSDLLNWKEGGRTYQNDGKAFPGWECQDFYPLEVDGDPNNVKWVYNAAGSWYAVGDLVWSEGSYNFYADTDVMLYNGESNQEKDKTLSNGYYFEQVGDKSLYATQSFFNDKLGRRISISWLQNTQTVTTSWNGYQTLAYEQTLKSTADGGYLLYSYPVEEVNGNRLNPIYHAEDITVGETTANILGDTNLLVGDIEAEITLGENTTEVGFTVRSNGTNYFKVYYDVANKQLVVDKTQSGTAYVGQYGNPTMPMSVLDGNKIKFRIVIDNGVLEFFGNDGEAPIVSMANPLQNGGMSFYVKGSDVAVNDLTVYSMQSIWFDKAADGDLNGDGIVDICDLVKGDKFVSDKNTAVKASFDLNKDKNLDKNDMAELRKKIIK